MQPGIVPVRVDYVRLIHEWVIVGIVAFSVALGIWYSGAGVKPGVPPVSEAPAAKPAGPTAVSPGQSNNNGNIFAPGTFDDPYPNPRDYSQDVNTLPPDESGMRRYLLACLLLGVAALALTGLYVPWLGRLQGEAEQPSANRVTLIPAGYAWLWHSYRVPARLPAKQAEK